MSVAAVSFTIGWRPFIGPKARATTNRQFERTAERLARGRYPVVGLVGLRNLSHAERLEYARRSRLTGDGTGWSGNSCAQFAGRDRSVKLDA